MVLTKKEGPFSMKKILLASLVLASLGCFAAQAQDASGNAPANGGWTGSGELGFASTTGNTRSQNLDAKLGLNQENAQWKNSFFLDALRSKSQVKVENPDGSTYKKYNTTANRYDGGASVGYKLDPRSYIVGAGRYEHDDFGANRWQAIVSIGYGYIALKTQRTELSFEIGPGYKEYQPADTTITVGDEVVPYHQDRQKEVVARGLVNYKFRLTANTSFDDTFLMEAGSKDKYFQNDAGLAVSMTKKLSLKVGYEVRHNSTVLPGVKKTDTLATTNIVYNL
jgi:putative salt-induced outer membrane protein